jgi:HEPN domain-containing protein
LSLLAQDLRRLSQQADEAPATLQEAVSLRLRRVLSSLSGQAFDTLSLRELKEYAFDHKDEHIRALALNLAPLEEARYSGKVYVSKKVLTELIEVVEALAAREGL